MQPGLLGALMPQEDIMAPVPLVPRGLIDAMGPSVMARMGEADRQQQARWQAGERAPMPLTEENMWLADDVAGGLLGPIGMAGIFAGVGAKTANRGARIPHKTIRPNLVDVPVAIVDGTGRPQFSIRNGVPTIEGGFIGEADPQFRRYLDEFVQPFGENTFVRAVKNVDDLEYLKSGKHRGSINHVTGEPEGGLSVAHSLEFPSEYHYLVEGKVIGQGTDGEPLLDLATARPLTNNLTLEQLRAIEAERLPQSLARVGLTPEDYRLLGSSGRPTRKVPSWLPDWSPPTPDLPEQIAGLLAQGRASEVTDDMLGLLDANQNARLVELYESGATGQALPMDQASRMARAREMGFGGPLYHGTSEDFAGFDRSRFGTGAGDWSGKGVYSTPDAFEAVGYGDFLMPIASRAQNPDVKYLTDYNWRAPDGFSKYLAEQGHDALDVRVKDIDDRTGEVAADWLKERVDFDPTNIRSRFARFDPRLARNANLLASLGGAGLLGALAMPDDTQ